MKPCHSEAFYRTLLLVLSPSQEPTGGIGYWPAREIFIGPISRRIGSTASVSEMQRTVASVHFGRYDEYPCHSFPFRRRTSLLIQLSYQSNFRAQLIYIVW